MTHHDEPRNGRLALYALPALPLAAIALPFYIVVPSFYADNFGISLAMLERVGMRREAHFVESLWFKGAWADDVVCAMLAREWREGGGTGRDDGQGRRAGQPAAPHRRH